MTNTRRNIRDMPVRRRHDGMTVLERMAETRLWKTIVTMLQVTLLLPIGFMKVVLVHFCLLLIGEALSMRRAVWNPVDPINLQNSNRTIDSFSDEECYQTMRFRKAELFVLRDKFNFPPLIVLENGTSFTGEYALCLMLYRLHYPCTLISLQPIFGRDYTQLSRIFNYAVDYVHTGHANKVIGNVDWYADRFDLYNTAYNTKLANLPNNPLPGTVPVQLNNLFGSIDCTANEICRPTGNNNAQFPFFNQYHHGHFIIWQGVTFPDGMVVLEGPEPGYFTDIMVWRDCQLNISLEQIMQERMQQNKQRLKLYGDKIYNTCALITAAWSLRHGPVLPWMTAQNGLMSRIRVHVEWAFERIITACKFAAFSRTQMIQKSPLAKYYTVAVLLANAHTCFYGAIDNVYFNVVPPTVDDYFNQ